MNFIKYIGFLNRREKIVQRLLDNKHITAAEAVELLKIKEVVNIKVGDVSSGARFTIGEDNTVENK